MRKKRSLVLVFSGLAAATLVTSPAALASGEPSARPDVTAYTSEPPADVLTDAEERELLGWLTENGVSSDRATSLVQKWDDGHSWDSLLGVEPVNVVSSETPTAFLERSEYPDGSIKIASIQKGVAFADEGVTTKSVTECSGHATGSFVKYENCKVEDSYGSVTAGFRADYTINRGTADSIQNAYQPWVYVTGGTFSEENLVVDRPIESIDLPTHPAQVSHSFKYSVKGEWAEGTQYHWLRVQDDKAFSEHQF